MQPEQLPESPEARQQQMLKSLQARFAEVPDLHQQGKVLHRLDEVLMVAFCAVLCDCDSFTDMEDFAKTQLAWLRGFLVLEHGAPSHDVFRNMLLALRPQALLDILTSWCGELSGRHVAIDSKTLRGSHDAEQCRHLVHLVRAWVDEYSLSAGQVVCAEKSNEIEAIPRLLESLSLRGATVTIDAMGTQVAIAEQILAAGADYVLSFKANQKGALQAVEAHFQEPAQASPVSTRAKPLSSRTGAARRNVTASSMIWTGSIKAENGRGCKAWRKCAAASSARMRVRCLKRFILLMQFQSRRAQARRTGARPLGS